MSISEDILKRIKVRAGWSDTNAFLTDPEILELCDADVKGAMWPQLHATHGDWHLRDKDYTLVGGRALYRLPSKIWGSIQDLGFVVNGEFVGGSVITVEELGNMGTATRPNLAGVPGYIYLKGDFVGVAPVPSGGETLRVIYYPEPASLCLSTEARRMVSVTGSSVLQLQTAPPAGWLAGTTLDIVGGGGSHQLLAESLVVLSTGATTVSLIAPLSAATIATLESGDWVCPTGKTPEPQIPSHMEPQLMQRVAAVCMSSNGDNAGFQRSAKLAGDLESRGLPTISPRQDAEPQFITPRRGFYR